MRRTKSGLTLTYRNTEWVGPDGLAIGRVRAIESCDHPHPYRWKDEAGRVHQEYCEGASEHDREVGWDIRQYGGTPPGMADDTYPTLTEAWDALAQHLAKTTPAS